MTITEERKPENCRKVDNCFKIKMILDKDLLEFQYREAAKEVCSKCPDFEGRKGGNQHEGEAREHPGPE